MSVETLNWKLFNLFKNKSKRKYIEVSKTKRDYHLFIYATFHEKYLNKKNRRNDGKQLKNTNKMFRFLSIILMIVRSWEKVKNRSNRPKCYEICAVLCIIYDISSRILKKKWKHTHTRKSETLIASGVFMRKSCKLFFFCVCTHKRVSVINELALNVAWQNWSDLHSCQLMMLLLSLFVVGCCYCWFGSLTSFTHIHLIELICFIPMDCNRVSVWLSVTISQIENEKSIVIWFKCIAFAVCVLWHFLVVVCLFICL